LLEIVAPEPVAFVVDSYKKGVADLSWHVVNRCSIPSKDDDLIFRVKSDAVYILAIGPACEQRELLLIAEGCDINEE
jgi:hypothetical protein